MSRRASWGKRAGPSSVRPHVQPVQQAKKAVADGFQAPKQGETDGDTRGLKDLEKKMPPAQFFDFERFIGVN